MVLALGAFYRAMALGSVSVVATIGALGVLVPVAAGLIQGDRPAAIQAAGAAVGITGVVLVAREPDPEWRAAGRTSVGLAALAALGFGTFFLGLDAASGPKPAWTIVAARAGGVATLLIAAAFVRPSMRIERSLLPALLAIGCFDVLANSLFAVATNHGAPLAGRRRRLPVLGGHGPARPLRARRAPGPSPAGRRRCRPRRGGDDRCRRLA